MSIAVDPSQWRESELYEEITINKSKALSQYKLREKDLDGLEFHVGKIVNYKGFKVDTYFYKEIEVERRAWERYGGPEAFEAVSPTRRLQKKHEEHQQKPRPRKQFQQPAQYARGALKRKLGARTDPHIKRSRALWQIRDAMPRWLWQWHARNEALDVRNNLPADTTVAKKGKGKGKIKPLFDTDRKREAALRLVFALPMAQTNTYATRPITDPDAANDAGAAQSSPQWQRLLGVLNEAPRLPTAAGERGAGLVLQTVAAPQAMSATYLYEWDTPYLDRLHDVLAAVGRVHGGGPEG